MCTYQRNKCCHSENMLRQATYKPEQPGKWWKTEDWERATLFMGNGGKYKQKCAQNGRNFLLSLFILVVQCVRKLALRLRFCKGTATFRTHCINCLVTSSFNLRCNKLFNSTLKTNLVVKAWARSAWSQVRNPSEPYPTCQQPIIACHRTPTPCVWPTWAFVSPPCIQGVILGSLNSQTQRHIPESARRT
jgi:hypothetical protein